jgi:hypothetical protein
MAQRSVGLGALVKIGPENRHAIPPEQGKRALDLLAKTGQTSAGMVCILTISSPAEVKTAP